MNNPMPKDNEVDEKDMPEPLTYGMRRKGETAVIGLIPPKVHAIPPKVAEYLRDYEEVPLYSAATVAEMRARADAAERRVGELEAFVTAVRTECFDYYNEGIRPWPHHMQTLAWKADEVLKHATLTGADPT